MKDNLKNIKNIYIITDTDKINHSVSSVDAMQNYFKGNSSAIVDVSDNMEGTSGLELKVISYESKQEYIIPITPGQMINLSKTVSQKE